MKVAEDCDRYHPKTNRLTFLYYWDRSVTMVRRIGFETLAVTDLSRA